jgi:hypothetical protein
MTWRRSGAPRRRWLYAVAVGLALLAMLAYAVLDVGVE